MEWLNRYRNSISPKTTSRRLTSVRAFARWAQIPTPELIEYSTPTAPRAMPHPIPEGVAGVRRMIDACYLSHHEAYIALCGLCGLRSSEALGVQAGDFDFATMNLTVRGKGDVTRIVPVSPEAWDALASSVVRSHGGAQVVGLKDRFARRLVTELGQRAQLSRHVSSHDLRATFATAVYNKTQDMRLVQMLLGHASVTTTQVYVGRDAQMLADAVRL